MEFIAVSHAQCRKEMPISAAGCDEHMTAVTKKEQRSPDPYGLCL